MKQAIADVFEAEDYQEVYVWTLAETKVGLVFTPKLTWRKGGNEETVSIAYSQDGLLLYILLGPRETTAFMEGSGTRRGEAAKPYLESARAVLEYLSQKVAQGEVLFSPYQGGPSEDEQLAITQELINKAKQVLGG